MAESEWTKEVSYKTIVPQRTAKRPTQARLDLIVEDLKAYGNPEKVISAAQLVQDLSKTFIDEVVRSCVPPMLLWVVRYRSDATQVAACLSAMKSMSAWPRGRQEFRNVGALQVLENYVIERDGDLRQKALETLSNLLIDEIVRDQVLYTQIPLALKTFVIHPPDDQILESTLSSLVNLTLGDVDALGLFEEEGLVPSLLDIWMRKDHLKLHSLAGLILSYFMNFDNLRSELDEAMKSRNPQGRVNRPQKLKSFRDRQSMKRWKSRRVPGSFRRQLK